MKVTSHCRHTYKGNIIDAWQKLEAKTSTMSCIETEHAKGQNKCGNLILGKDLDLSGAIFLPTCDLNRIYTIYHGRIFGI